MVLTTQTGESIHWNFTMWDLYASPLAPSPSILPPSLLSILGAFYLTCSGKAGQQDGRMSGCLSWQLCGSA